MQLFAWRIEIKAQVCDGRDGAISGAAGLKKHSKKFTDIRSYKYLV